MALLRGVPGPRHRRRRDERAGAEPARSAATTSMRWPRRSPTAPASIIVCSPNNPTGIDRHRRRVRGVHGTGARPTCSCCSTRRTSSSSADEDCRRRPHADRPVPEPRHPAHVLEGLRARRAARRLRDRTGATSSTPPAPPRSPSASPRPRPRPRSRPSSPPPRRSCSTGSRSSPSGARPCARPSSSRAGRCPSAHGNFVWLPTGDAHDGRRRAAVRRRASSTRAFPPEGIRISIGEPESVETLLRILGELVPASQEGHPA